MGYTNINAQSKRDQIKGLIDDFATFQWRGANAWEKFGVFIINEKSGSLKFYNGPSFNNEYSTPMFSSSSGNLMGVNFKIQPIKFKIGMYWFTIEEYQEFIEWINPYEINYLSFGFESEYGYLVKLASISDSPRHIIGHDANGKPVYYTEMELGWEIQGNSCVRSNLPYEWVSGPWNNGGKSGRTWNLNTNGMTEKSLLDTPIVLEVPVSVLSNNTSGEGQLFFQISLDKGKKWTDLFNVVFENLIPGTEDLQDVKPVEVLETGKTYYLHNQPTERVSDFKYKIRTDNGDKEMFHILFDINYGWYCFGENDIYPISSFPFEFIAVDTEIPKSLKGCIWSTKETVQEGLEDDSRPSKFTIKYDSETGIVFIQIGSEGTWKILSCLTDTVSGDYLVESIDVHKYLLPGSFTNDNYNMDDVRFKLELEGLEVHDDNVLTIYSRKNVI